VAIGGISGFLGVGSTLKLVEFCWSLKAAFAYYNWGSWDETTRQSTAYNTLKERFKCHLPANPVAREDLISSMLMAITPTAEARGYRLIVGEDGTGKSTLVALALERLGETKGVVYIETWILDALGSSFNFANAMKKALGLKPNPIDNPRIWTEPFWVTAEANGLQALTVHDGWEIFSDFAAKYKQEHGKIPVLIIDNADRLAKSKPEILDALQDYAKEATDERTATVVFVSGEGFLPRMRGKFI
jgi:Cdc6-like AAA superfamily ATPase